MNRYCSRLGEKGGVCAFFISFLILLTFDINADDRQDPLNIKSRPIDNSPVINGEFVHNVGSLQMNITNWGIIGSLPGSNYPMRDVPSAQYPAGSGIEYLFAAGIWVGAVRNGIPTVSTGYPEDEFRPKQDYRHTIYESYEGDLRGSHLPSFPDDDRDGLWDEDFLNGYDDDRDGKIDEDFRSYGNQYFSCEYTDNQPQSKLIWPEHEPMEIRIRQETFQWGDDVYNDFICARYTITNIGIEHLTEIYIGFYADVDAGPRDIGTYHMDDQVGYWAGDWCASKGEAEQLVNIYTAYVYDSDGDNGRTPGYFGIVLLGHTTTVNGSDSPRFPSKRLVSFKIFQGLQPFANGGDPTNDFERYQVISDYGKDGNTDKPGDYKFLISTGPFFNLSLYKSIEVDIAFVAGNNFEEMLDHAATAQLVYNGIWYDLDGDPGTGVIGRESPVVGPLTDYDPDYCDGIKEELDIAKFDTIWSNLDCSDEMAAYRDRTCYKPYGADLNYYKTGVGGKEHNLHFLTGSAPPPPSVRLVPRNHGVEVYWDDISETTPDIITGEYDFEGYQIWRADDWHRPLGSSIDNGPSHDLWSILEVRDLINGLLPNIDFKKPFEQGGWEYTPLLDKPDRDMLVTSFEQSLIYAPLDTVPCPPGVTPEECDTLEALARLNLGYEGGKKYYKFVDDSAKNGMPYFYSVVAYDHIKKKGIAYDHGNYNSPSGSFQYVVPLSGAQSEEEFDEEQIYVVPNPVTTEAMSGWELGPTNEEPSGVKLEIRNLPACRSTIRIYTLSGDLVQTISHDGSSGNGTAMWNLVSRNGQDIGSGVYLFSVEPSDGRFERAIGKFVVIR